MKTMFDSIINSLRESIINEYQETNEYCLLKEKHDKMCEICGDMFVEEQLDSLYECFTVSAELHGAETEYLCKKAFLCGVSLTKEVSF